MTSGNGALELTLNFHMPEGAIATIKKRLERADALGNSARVSLPFAVIG